MAYATTQQAIDLYGEDYVLESVDRDDDAEVDSTAFGDSLDQATSELNSYIGAAYDLPLATVPDVLVRFTVDVAVYIASPSAMELTDEKKDRYDAAIKWAMAIAKGVLTLGLDEPAAAADEQGGTVLTSPATSDRAFTRATQRGLR